ncbi:MAG TPA: ABC transporter permease [Blastocatellia bacterium]|nr:ABC transporter permease [Blastocatellia bacterium]HMZ22429.1 ABC transporter permease [Blastocatellia bacterium]HNG30449.1 ABC transporter permease [Blastocatellia bacterium]
MQRLWQDLRYGVRMLVKQPGFALIAIATLALGIGANTAIFTVVNAALLRGLPYRAPERLVHLFETTPQQAYSQREFSYPDYQDYQQSQAFEGIAAYSGGGGILTGRGEPQRIFAPAVSANFFNVLGVEPLLGRTFRTGEDSPGAERVTVLTYGLWQRMFGGDPGIIGQTLTISNNQYTVIGVLPPSFQFALRPADLWLPYQPTQNQLTRRFMHGTNLIGRLRAGVSVEQANTEAGAIAQRIAAEHKESHAGVRLLLTPLQQQVTGAVKPVLLALLAAVGFVLLMVCANVAGLLLARSLARQKEIALRTALGATRGRVVRQLLTEALLLSVLGAAGGLLIARFGLDALVAALPQNQLAALPFFATLKLDPGILMFTLGLALLTGVVFGLAPALQASRLDLQEALKEGGRTTGGARQRLRGALVVTQLALAVVLLVGAGLMMKSLLRLMQVNLGFDPTNVLTMTVVLPANKYTEPNRMVAYYRQLEERLVALPGVVSAGTVSQLPLQPGNTTRFIVEGEPVPPPDQETEANIRTAGDSYFSALGIPLLQGRNFNERDQADGTQVVIINQSLADKLLGGRNPLGRRLLFPSFPDQTVEVVGVVGDVKTTGLDQAARPVLYYPFTQNASTGTNLVVRGKTDAAMLTEAVRNECRALEPDVALFNVQTMETLIEQTPAAVLRRLPTWLTGIFAVVALLLAGLGVYGVVSYSVNQQTHDIGVRMALGARRTDILKLVMRQGLALAVAGVALGAVAALALTRWLNSLLYEVSARDPLIFAAVVGTLLLVALAACWIPARRATKLDPMIALRSE